MRGLRFIGAGALALVIAAAAASWTRSSLRSTSGVAAAAAPPTVSISGCAALRAGPVCELAPDRRVRLIVSAAAGAPITLRSGDGAAAIDARARVRVGDKERLDVEIPDGARALDVIVGTGATASAPWRHAVEPLAVPPWLRDARAARARGALDDAWALAHAHEEGPEAERGLAFGLVARIALMRGAYVEAVRAFEAARAAHAAAGRISDAFDDGLAESFALTERLHDYARARRVLADIEPLGVAYPDGWAALPYYEAIVARATGDVRQRVERAREADARAQLLGLEVERREALAEQARAQGESGRFQQACRLYRQLTSGDATGERGCARPNRLVNLAVMALDAVETTGEIPSECPADPVPVIRRTIAELKASCPERAELANAWIVLARALAVAGDAAGATEALEGSTRHANAHSSQHRIATAVLAGRAALLRGAWDEAGATFERARREADERGMRWHALRALLGSVRALAARGDPSRALETLVRGLRPLEESAIALPVGDGRASFAGTLDVATRVRFDLLLDLRRDGDALREALASRSRAAWGAEVGERLHALPVDRRARWDDAVGAYHRTRGELEVATRGARELSAREWAERRSSLEIAERDVRRALGEALDAAGSAHGEEAARWPCPGDPAGTTWLVLRRTERGVVAIAGGSDGLSRRAVVPSLPDDPEGRARALLVPLEESLARAVTLRVVTDAPLAHLDVHALPWRGAPLGTRIAVEYSVSGQCPRPPAPGAARPWTVGALVVSDPRGDLPGARTEARNVGAVLAGLGAKIERLDQREARGQAMRAALAHAPTLHFAGHARHGDEPWASSLLLHDGDRLDVADILALPDVPRIVALSACEGAEETHDAMGIAQAFVRKGADAVVAPVRPVRDRANVTFWARYYEALAARAPSPAAAARDALEHVARSAPEDLADALAYRVLVR